METVASAAPVLLSFPPSSFFCAGLTTERTEREYVTSEMQRRLKRRR